MHPLRRPFAAVVALALGVASASAARAEDKPLARPAKSSDSTTKRVSMEIAGYGDSTHVGVFTPTIAGTVENVTAGASLSGRYIVDVVSAASVDIVATASRRWTEVRHAGSLEWEYKPHDFGVSVAGSTSVEPDYRAYTGAVGFTHDFDQKNRTLLLGFGYGHDTIGRSGTPFEVFSRSLDRLTLNAGLAFVMNPTTLGSVSADFTVENGDQSKPYRYVPMFSAAVAATVPAGASIDWVHAHRLPERPLEQLPLARRRVALSARLAHRLDGSTLRLDERLYDDTWALVASTTDARWVFDLGKRVALWPHARFHVQSGTAFWQRAYVSGGAPGWNVPVYRTGDRELGPLWALTGGGGARVHVGGANEPRALTVGFHADVIYTSFKDTIYLTDRTGFLGALTLEGEL